MVAVAAIYFGLNLSLLFAVITKNLKNGVNIPQFILIRVFAFVEIFHPQSILTKSSSLLEEASVLASWYTYGSFSGSKQKELLPNSTTCL